MALSLLVLALALAPAPTEAGGATSVAAWQPTADATATTTTTAASPTVPPPSESTPTPAPVAASPAAAPAPEDSSKTTAAGATNPGPPPDTQPVLRAAPGNWGMTFIFGGLGPLSIAGHGDQPLADGIIFTEIGVRRVFKKFVLPFSFGAGITHRQPPGTARPETAAGISASIAILKGFRVWRRIAPYTGAFIHAHYVDAPGPDNWLVGLSVGPILGIEYFLADRVSLYGQGILAIGPDINKGTYRMVVRSAMAAGGQLGLTFYF